MGLNYFINIFNKNKENRPTEKERFDSALEIARIVYENNPEDIHAIIKTIGKNIQYAYLSKFIQVSGSDCYSEDSREVNLKLNLENLWIDWFFLNLPDDVNEWFRSNST